ncbi:MAG: ABC transporter permease [Actinomycetota bacterium]|nr:ABC transporter permease [Actinomycetota bacterium]
MSSVTSDTSEPGGPDRVERHDPAVGQSPLRTTLDLTWRQLDYWLTVYRRTWKGSVVSSFLMPVLYLAAMGIGLGGFIDSPGAQQRLGGVSYLEFVAPGLLAATAMQTALGESTYPVMGNFRWTKVYLAMVATPLSVASVLLAHLGYVAFRLVTTCAVFLLVLSLFGLVPGVGAALLVLVVAVVVGLAHATPVFAYAAHLKDTGGFAVLFRLGVIPMFLFSGAFFPVAQLPGPFEGLAYVTPLYHGVELARMLTTGEPLLGLAVLHLAYLLAWLAVGGWLAHRVFTRRLVN